MQYISTRAVSNNTQDRKRFCEILLEGLAPDGGLYMPVAYPQVDDATLTRWRKVYHEQGYAELIAAQRDFEFDEADPVKGMRELVRHSWLHYLNHPQLVRLLVTENLLRAKYLKKSSRIKGTLMPLMERASSVLAAGQKAGVFRRDADPQRILMTVMSLGFFYLSNQFTTAHWLEVDLMDPAVAGALATAVMPKPEAPPLPELRSNSRTRAPASAASIAAQAPVAPKPITATSVS